MTHVAILPTLLVLCSSPLTPSAATATAPTPAAPALAASAPAAPALAVPALAVPAPAVLAAAVPAARRAVAATTCIWDSDTLADELRGIPDAFSLISGRWVRHSDAYYRARLANLPALLDKAPARLALYDDLAVAHEYLGDDAKAIEVMRRKGKQLAKTPNKEQQYRYHANLGTFYAHAALRGRLAKGFERALSELDKALEINPEAHFGRERFQVDLIRYALAAKQDPTLWTKHSFLTWSGYQIEKRYWSGRMARTSFTAKHREIAKKKKATWQQAYTAVAGMLRFGGIEGGELYRCLGDLFMIRQDLHLAWWAYRRAEERGHPARAQLAVARKSIERHWRETKKHVRAARSLQVPTERIYGSVRANAKAWRAAFAKAEARAIEAKRDVSKDEQLRALVNEADRLVPAPKIGSRGTRRAGSKSRREAKNSKSARAVKGGKDRD